jgi:hypothetical protein
MSEDCTNCPEGGGEGYGILFIRSEDVDEA